jgi:HlyD family secretion protein
MKLPGRSKVEVVDGVPATAVKIPEKKQKKFKKPKKIKPKQIIILVIILAVLAIGAFLLIKLFFGGDKKVVLSDTTTYGALNATITGTGTTTPADSKTYKLAAAASILEVDVAQGDTVTAGQLLYKQDSSTLDSEIEGYQNNLTEYEDNISDYQEQITTLKSDIAALTSTASISGTVTNVSVEKGNTVKSGTVLATIVDSSKMKVTQYFSYAYQNDIYVGQSATVSVPSLMTTLTGTVSDINYVNRTTDEGTQCFAVTITVTNPGALTKGMSVGAYVNSSGGYIYPSVEGTLEYNSSKDITAKGDGELTVCNAVNYQTVKAGQTLFQIDSDTYQTQIDTLEKQISRAEEQVTTVQQKITDDQAKYENYNVYSEIAGRVVKCSIKAGDEGSQGDTAVIIYNMDSMYVTIDIAETDIDYITQGMEVALTKEGAEKNTEYTGTVSEISLEATTTSGVSTYPVKVSIDSEGELSPGVSLTYSISTGDTEECVLCPIAAIQNLDEGTFVFVKADQKPADAVDLSSNSSVDIPDGYYAVKVETGTSNAKYTKILSGLDKDQTVFTGYQQTAPSGGTTTSNGGTSTSTSAQQGGPQMGGQMPSGGGGGMPGGN